MPHKSQPTTCPPCSWGARLLLPRLTQPRQQGHFKPHAESSASLQPGCSRAMASRTIPSHPSKPGVTLGWVQGHLPPRLSPFLQSQRDKAAASSRLAHCSLLCHGMAVFTLPSRVISAVQAVRSQPAPSAWCGWRAEAATAHRDAVESGGCTGNMQELGSVYNPCCSVWCRDF